MTAGESTLGESGTDEFIHFSDSERSPDRAFEEASPSRAL